MEVGEGISVLASFGPSYIIKPLRFRWGGRLLDVGEVTYTWKTREGDAEVYHFSVAAKDIGTLYELTFDTGTLGWRLEALEALEA